MSIAFICVALSFLLVYLTKIPVSIAMNQLPGGYDNKNPRQQQAELSGWGKRAVSAHQNSFETFAPFAVGVFVAHLGGGSPVWCEAFALIFVISRCFYIAFYLLNWDLLRSSVWFVGFLSTIGLYALPLTSKFLVF
ncbi:MAG: MAPEG family protein [Deltaproteobacteria bacterium]|nr:MAPEG family protein [Deltaproteobacteria bacterium]